MPSAPRTSPWRPWIRRLLWLKLALGILCLPLAGFAVYVHFVGLPAFIKTPLLAQLRSHGLDLQFARLRWHFVRGIIADQVRMGEARASSGPRLWIDSLELHLQRRALLRGRIVPGNLAIRNARLTWPLPAVSNLPPWRLEVDHVQGRLRPAPDRWEIESLEGECLGIHWILRGSLTNAPALPRTPSKGAPSDNRSLADRFAPWVRLAIGQWERWIIDGAPQLAVDIHADAAAAGPWRFSIEFSAPQARSADQEIRQLNLRLQAHSAPVENQPEPGWNVRLDATALRIDAPPFQGNDIAIELDASGTATPIRPSRLAGHAQARSVRLHSSVAIDRLSATGHWTDQDATPVNSRIRIEAGPLRTPAVSARHLALTAAAAAAPARLWPRASAFAGLNARDWMGLLLGSNLVSNPQIHLAIEQPNSIIAQASSITLDGEITGCQPASPLPAELDGTFWEAFYPLRFNAAIDLDRLASPDLDAARVQVRGRWDAPCLSLERLDAQLHAGQLLLTGRVDALTRRIALQAESSIDVHRLAPLLSESGRRWLSQYGFQTPPQISGQAAATWPPWTRRSPDWRTEILPHLQLEGDARAQNGDFRRVPYSDAAVHFFLSNGVWRVPMLYATRPEGRLDLTYDCPIATQDYHWGIRSTIDPRALAPILSPAQQRALDFFVLSDPPRIEGDLWGRWKALERTGFAGHLSLPSFRFRGESLDQATGSIDYTNGWLHARDVRILHGAESVAVSGLGFDTAAQCLWLTNAIAQIDPGVILRPIGPKTAAIMEPYRFLNPPTVCVDGSLQVNPPVQADLRFAVEGGPFHWWRLQFDRVRGQVDWTGDRMAITQFQGAAYQGRITGSLDSRFSPDRGSDLEVQCSVSGVNMAPLMDDLFSDTNRLEGLLNGEVSIPRLNTRDWNSWQGQGWVSLRDGLLWDIPMFGLFSPILNSIIPGLGNSRAHQGNASFTIQDSVFHTRDLEIRSPPVRLKYDGTIDFAGQVNAQVEAAFFGDTVVIGPLLRWAMLPVSKVFEYKVTGTLGRPRSEPLYMVPRLLLMPLQPVKTIKGIFVPRDPPTNSPAPR